MVIECKHVWEHISEYLDGTLAPEILEQVQKHLEHCAVFWVASRQEVTRITSCRHSGRP